MGALWSRRGPRPLEKKGPQLANRVIHRRVFLNGKCWVTDRTGANRLVRAANPEHPANIRQASNWVNYPNWRACSRNSRADSLRNRPATAVRRPNLRPIPGNRGNRRESCERCCRADIRPSERPPVTVRRRAHYWLSKGVLNWPRQVNHRRILAASSRLPCRSA